MDSLDINEHHQSMLNGYSELNRYQRQKYVRSIESTVDDVIQSKLLEDTYTRDEVTEILGNIRTTVVDELEAELINVFQTNVLMLCQLFRQAEKWHLQLTIDLSEMQNKELLEKVKDIDKAPMKLEKIRLSPWSTDVEKTSEVLRLEILGLQEENRHIAEEIKILKQQVENTQLEKENLRSESEEKEKLIEELKIAAEKANTCSTNSTSEALEHPETEKILADYDIVLKEQISQELDDMKKKLDTAHSQLTLAEMELGKRVNETAPYKNMKNILSKKNDQIKELRNRLLKYEPDEVFENGTLEEED